LIDPGKIRENAVEVVRRAGKMGIGVFGVTKGFCAVPKVARAMVEGGCSLLMDSRVKNLRRLREAGFTEPLMLLRIPMLSELEELVEVADGTVVSMPETVLALEKAASAAGKSMEVMVMADVGDLREGLWPDEMEAMGKTLASCRRVRCMGVGTNIGCFGGVLPTPENMNLLVECRDRLAAGLGGPVEVVSGGATSSLELVDNGLMPREVNNLRVGEAILLGFNTGRMQAIPGLHRDAFVLEAEIVEVRTKPSRPIGLIGADAFGKVPVFEDRGRRLRAIAAVGKQDAKIDGLAPLDPGVSVLGASSDHLTLDVEDCPTRPVLGGIVRFTLDYGAMLALTTSNYVEKAYVLGVPTLRPSR
jgi:predicted amino acid racemase